MFHHALAAGQMPPILYKDGRTTKTMSIREVAKRQGSAVGEMYSVESMKSLIEAFQFDPGYFSPSTTDEYIDKLKNLIDSGRVATVFYDVDLSSEKRFGHPYIPVMTQNGRFWLQ